ALFHPESGSDIHDIRNFWKKELRVAEKFLSENEQFYTYYKSGMTEMDEVYFLRTPDPRDPSGQPIHRNHYAGAFFQNNSSHDGIFSAIVARDKYLNYVKRKIEIVETQSF
ncbi:MAG: RteC domain-containing protein, partial [Chitinophagaceae bacterium]|nr:RteC domain-containing protein [Chitinophagaceae bacterium]